MFRIFREKTEMLTFIYLLAATAATANQETVVLPAPPPAPTIAAPAAGEETERVLIGKEQRAIPLGNPGQWVNTEDYPAIALQQERIGTTSFRVQVNRSGPVAACEVTVSSGHSDLDAATCKYVTERAMFSPARDKNGRMTSDAYANRVRWQIPDSPLNIPSPGTRTFVFTVENDGTVSDCKMTGAGLDEKTDPCANAPRFVPPVNQQGIPVSKQVVTTTTTRVGTLADKE